MGKIRVYPPVKIFAAVTWSDEAAAARAEEQLSGLLSTSDFRSEVFDFSAFTDYYAPEMGGALRKFFLAFTELRPAESLPDLKLAANRIEEEIAAGEPRIVNIDPGYLCAAKVVLATTKDYDHRLYLNRGIFGDVHLRFRNGRFRPNEWTYPDYKQPLILDFFMTLRAGYLSQLKDWQPAGG